MKKDGIMAFFAIVVFYGILQLLGITCPIKYITGISCAGCGMTRAMLCALQLDFAGAFHYHPLFPLPPLILLVIWQRDRLKKQLYYGILFTAVVLFVIIYMLRMIGSDSIVVFEPQQGALYRFYHHLRAYFE